MKADPCRCGSAPDVFRTTSGLVRISCANAKCEDIVCARPMVAVRAWNEANPRGDDDVTLVDCDIPVFEGPPIDADDIKTEPRIRL